MAKLNPNAQKWVDALRSGQYKQTRQCLRDGKGGHCCLGVGCEVALQNGVAINVEGDCFDGMTAFLPEIARKWLGLKSDAGSNGATDLVILNDTRRLTFPEIADFIETYAFELGVSA